MSHVEDVLGSIDQALTSFDKLDGVVDGSVGGSEAALAQLNHVLAALDKWCAWALQGGVADTITVSSSSMQTAGVIYRQVTDVKERLAAARADLHNAADVIRGVRNKVQAVASLSGAGASLSGAGGDALDYLDGATKDRHGYYIYPDQGPPRTIMPPTPIVLRHICWGEGNPESGGHMYGVNPNKTQFPKKWEEDDVAAALEFVAKIATEPRWMRRSGHWRFTGTSRGVKMSVLVRPNGRIDGGWPISGPGVTRQPKRRKR